MKLILSLLSVLLISGCAYTYSESAKSAQITSNTFRISAEGNEYNKNDEIQDFLFLKAAETTLEQGHTHFYFINVDDTSKTSIYSTPGKVTTTNYGGYVSTNYVPGYVGTSNSPGSIGLINVFTPSQGNASPEGAFDALEIMKNIKSRVDDN